MRIELKRLERHDYTCEIVADGQSVGYAFASDAHGSTIVIHLHYGLSGAYASRDAQRQYITAYKVHRVTTRLQGNG